MSIGAVFPQTELGADPGEVREYGQAAEGMGYSHIFVADHVLEADPAHHPEVSRFPYTYKSTVHEPFTLLGYVAALTTNLGLVTGIVILPQRQTVLVAKQAAEVDVLSGGRMRLGVGVGWNPVEYETLGETFGNRGRRVEEQIDVLRALWTQEVVSYDGRWHKFSPPGSTPCLPSVPSLYGSAPAGATTSTRPRLSFGGSLAWPTAGSPCSDPMRQVTV